jgi:hypothetical protein
MFRKPGDRGSSGSMNKEATRDQLDEAGGPATVDLTGDPDPREVAQRGQSVLELSKELNSSSKALLEKIDPIG